MTGMRWLLYGCLFLTWWQLGRGQQSVFRRPGNAQTLSLRRSYTFDESTRRLVRLAYRPRDAQQQRVEGTAAELRLESRSYTMFPVLDTYSTPSASTLEVLHAAASRQGGRTRWRAVPLAQISMDQAWGWVPDVKNAQTVLALAMMSYDAYTQVGGDDWYDIDKKTHVNDTFGWDGDGLRGHVFANDDDSLLVIAFKGTTAGLFSGGPTGDKDKQNDNLLFSCCCGRISRAWRPVCTCFQDNDSKCEESCVQNTIMNEELYYDHALSLYRDLADAYPDSTIWLTGHSLGGGIASLVGQTYGVPAVSFEAPGDKMASMRLHLPRAPGARLPLWHFGNTADPIFIGECTGIASSCWYGGFAIETRCHTGKTCVWDTVKDKGWRVDIRSHRIGDVIEKILKQPDEFGLPECKVEDNCTDCVNWTFFDDRDNLESYRLANVSYF